jgi:hypothetical protein
MTVYSRVLMYASIVLVLLIITYVLYLYFFAPIPGDTTSVQSVVFRKNNPVRTNQITRIAQNVKFTSTGAFSFMFVMDEVRKFKDADPIMYPILSLHKSGASAIQDGPIAIRVFYNRLTSELVIGFYNTRGDIYTMPISTSTYKEKVSVLVRCMNANQSDMFLANLYLNGEYIASRGIPSDFGISGGNDHTIIAGGNDSISGRLQTIRVWDNASNLTDTDIMKISEDPFNVNS